MRLRIDSPTVVQFLQYLGKPVQVHTGTMAIFERRNIKDNDSRIPRILVSVHRVTSRELSFAIWFLRTNKFDELENVGKYIYTADVDKLTLSLLDSVHPRTLARLQSFIHNLHSLP